MAGRYELPDGSWGVRMTPEEFAAWRATGYSFVGAEPAEPEHRAVLREARATLAALQAHEVLAMRRALG